MWHWSIIWVSKDGETCVLESERGWNTMEEAYTMVTSVGEFVMRKLYELGAVGVMDFSIVYRPRGGDSA